MNNRISRTLLMALMLCASTAVAEPDTFGLGTGRDGALTVKEPGTVINRYTQVTGPLAPGDTVLFVSSAEGFAAGDLVMVLQTTGIVPEPARGDPGPIDLSNDPVGRWELARVSAVHGQELKLAAPLLYSYAGMVTQLIRVPEYTDVTIQRGSSLFAVPWDGIQGGVLAFLASGTIHNEGELQASGAGFRGGMARPESQELIECMSLLVAARPGAGRGEGISSLDFGPFAMGLENASNGGGGGLCPVSGGGGGGNGAAGGRGGDSLSYGDWARDIGGRGGAGLSYSMLDHLTLGGGGGQGYGRESHSRGGAGGGGIFIRGHRLTGNGTVAANGAAGEDATGGGAGGGGAGGSIYLRIVDALECGLLSAQGGSGGSAPAGSVDSLGPSGGGGGGGRVLYEASQLRSCPVSVEAGLAGDWYLAGATASLGAGAQPDASQLSAYDGSITKLTSTTDCSTTKPVFIAPTNNQVVGSRNPAFEIESADNYVIGIKVFFRLADQQGVSATRVGTSNRWTLTVPSAETLAEGGPHTIRATQDCTTGPDIAADSILVYVDITAPTLSIGDKPTDPTEEPTAAFTFNATNESRQVNFFCRWDSQAEVSCGTATGNSSVSFTIPGSLGGGSHTFYVRGVDEADNQGATVSYTWLILSPETTLTSTPPNASNIATATFEFTSDTEGSTFECSLDSAAYAPCTSPFTTLALPDGEHTFLVRAKAADVVDPSPATHTWVVDTVAPNTQLTASPLNPSNNASAGFSFSSTEEQSTFECKLDEAPYAPCTSPWTPAAPLADGDHTFSVRAKDAAGNEDDTPASHTWEVDTAAPDTQLTASPSDPSNDPSAGFSFSSTEEQSTFECKLDDAPYALCTNPWTPAVPLADGDHTFSVRAKDAAGNEDDTPASYTWEVDTTAPDTQLTASPSDPSNDPSAGFSFSSTEEQSTFECKLDEAPYAPCTSPWTPVAPLADGDHTFSVKATDVVGNVDPSPASYTWEVDTAAPDTQLTAHPPDPSNNPSAGFSFSATEAGGTFECKLDEAPYAPCSSPWTPAAPLTDGDHSFWVRARDAAGNVDDTPASYTWGVDTAAPDTELTGFPPNPSNNPSAGFSFRATEAGSTFECKLDGAPYAPCTSPWTPSAPLADGEHTFSVKAWDVAGNVDPTPASYTWGVDTVAPDTQLTGRPANPSNDPSDGFTFSATEVGSTFECKLDAAPYAPCSSPWTPAAPLTDGNHTFSVRARDAAGNADDTPASYAWEVDTAAPDTELTSTPPDPSTSASATFSFRATEVGSTFECKLDGAQYAPCNSPWPLSNLAEGSHTFWVRAKDAAGNVDPSPASHTWEVDTLAPDTLLTGRPANPSNDASAGFTFSATEAGSTFECKLDAALYAPCTSPWTPPAPLADGSHSFSVRARDEAGNVDPSPASYSWEVDTAAPDTELTSTPPDPSTSASATFSFRATEVGSTFECKLDGAQYAPCNSPWPLSNLAEGSHTFWVRAKDAAGNVDETPASHTWEVDTQAPDTLLTGRPANPSNDPNAGFTFSAEGEGITFECKLDEAPYAPCTSPWTPPAPLADGSHSFSVRAKDAAGNVDLSPASYTWEVDTAAPDTELTNTPPDPSTSASAIFSFRATEVGSTFECKLDAAPYAPCNSPWPLSGLAEDSHTFWVRAKDAAGNVDPSPANYTWEVDTVAPDTLLTSRPSDPSNEASAIFHFSATEVGSTFECKLDTAPYAPCNSPWPLSGLAEGIHTFWVRATDGAGNMDPSPASHTWEVDTILPDTLIESGPAGFTNETTATFTFREVAGNVREFRCAISWGDPQSPPPTSPPRGDYVTCESGKEYTALIEGTYTFSVYAVDPAGNAEEFAATYPWVVDLTAPDTHINSITREGGGALVSPTNSTSVTFRFSSTEAGGGYQCMLDSGSGVACDLGTMAYPRLEDGQHTFSVQAVDAAGNEDRTPATYHWVVDTVPPATRVINPWSNTTTKIWRTNQPSPTFKGKSERQSTVEIQVNNAARELIDLGETEDWEIQTTQVLPDGTHTVSVVSAVDLAKNRWTPPPGNPAEDPPPKEAYSFRFIVDTVAPETEIKSSPPKIHSSIIVSFALNAPGEPPELNTTFECKLVSHRHDKEIVGPCSKVPVYDLEIDFGIDDVNGKYTFSAAARDEAGNLDATPTFYEFDVFAQKPAHPEILSPSDGESVYDLTPTISGKTVPEGTVELFVAGVRAGLATADGEGLFTFKFPEPLEQVTHELTSKVTDAAGNRSDISPPTSFTVFEPKPVAEAIGGGLGCAASGAQPWLALLGLVAGTMLSSRRRRR